MTQLQATTEEQREHVLGIFGMSETCCHFPLDYDRESDCGYEEFDDRIYLDGNITFEKMAEAIDYLRSINPKKGALDLSIVSEEMKNAVETWLAYKKEKGQTYKPMGFKTFYKRLCELSGCNPHIAMQIVENSMQNNYAGIFPISNNHQSQTNGREERAKDAADLVSRLLAENDA